MDGELEDILDWLLLLLLNLLAILSLVLFYSIALNFCAVALHILSFRLTVRSHASAKLLSKGKRKKENKEQMGAQCPKI